jgi:hypothetical protein
MRLQQAGSGHRKIGSSQCDACIVKIAVLDQRVLEELHRLRQRGIAGDIPAIEAAQIEIVGIRVPGAHRAHTLVLAGTQQRHRQRIRNLVGDFVLDGEDVFQRTVVAARPQVRPVSRIDQLCGDTHALAGTLHRTLEHGFHPQLLGDLTHIHIGVLECERGGACSDAQLGDLRQHVQQRLGESVAEVLVVGVAAHVDEGQHRDGRAAVGIGKPRGGRLRCCRRRQHETVRDQHTHSDDEQHDGDDIKAFGGDRRDGLRAVHLRLALDALGCDLERPGEKQCNRQADGQQGNDDLADPTRRAVDVEYQRTDFDQQPGSHQVGRPDAEHIAALELVEQGHGQSPPTASIAANGERVTSTPCARIKARNGACRCNGARSAISHRR